MKYSPFFSAPIDLAASTGNIRFIAAFSDFLPKLNQVFNAY
jgi:hypothetical protein